MRPASSFSAYARGSRPSLCALRRALRAAFGLRVRAACRPAELPPSRGVSRMPLAAQSNEDELAALRLADEPAGRECAEDGGASAAGDAVSAQALSRAASDGAEEGNTGRASAPAHAARSASADAGASVRAGAGEDACGGEDDTSASWRARSKHVLVVSDAGKPIYSRHGASERLAGFAASLQAMTAYASAGGQGGALRWARRGRS